MKTIRVNGVTHGNYDPESKAFYRDVNPATHLFRIFDSYAHRIDGFEVMKKLQAEKYFLNENGKLSVADWHDLVTYSFQWKDQIILPKKLFTEVTDIQVINNEL